MLFTVYILKDLSFSQHLFTYTLSYGRWVSPMYLKYETIANGQDTSIPCSAVFYEDTGEKIWSFLYI